MFGEVALLHNCMRTATVKSRYYCTLASLNAQYFEDMLQQFPEFHHKMKEHTKKYDDPWKRFLKRILTNVDYLKGANEQILEELYYNLN